MNHCPIGLVAAMPEEVEPFLHLVGHYVKEKKGKFDLYRFQRHGQNVVLIRSGMGVSRAAAATKLLLETTRPRVIVNFGFAGAVKSGPMVGDLVLAERVLSYDGHNLTAAAPTIAVPGMGKHFHVAVFTSTFITTLQITEKKTLATIIPEGYAFPAVEMESAAVAHVAAEAGIPFKAIRAISDAADEELGFSLDEFTDGELNIRIGRVMKTIAKKPWIIPQLLRLAGNSRMAGKNLARGLDIFIQAC